ncbi:hypothetical protein WJX74_009855 [Apatococcus lobatus]|uniref:PCI domain-containing protein n=1 Tax=Apatococcus lobatus TaxID=904363 RepID=A0AAW1RLI1_9CHLO
MPAHLVETSEEDSFQAVANFIADLLDEGQGRTALAETSGSKFTEAAKEHLQQAELDKLVSLYVSQLDTLFDKAPERDLESCINIICHLLPRLSESQEASASEEVCKSLTSQDQHAEQRLHGLIQVLSTCQNPTTQFSLLLQALRYAKQVRLVGLLVPAIKSKSDEWVKELKLNRSQSRQLFHTCADTLRASKNKTVANRDALKLMSKCLALYEDADAEQLGEVRSVAADAVAAFIRNMDTFQFDLLENPAVQQLKGDSQYGSLFSLLELMLEGNMKGFQALSDGDEVFQQAGISHGDALQKMRILALLQLAARQRDLDFHIIQGHLSLEEDEVEMWVIQAIGKKLIDAQIDQLNERVTVLKCARTTFGNSQWVELQQQLNAWKASVADVREMVTSQRHTNGHLAAVSAA